MFKIPNESLLGLFFYNANDRNLDFFVKQTFSPKQSVLVEQTLRFGVSNVI